MYVVSRSHEYTYLPQISDENGTEVTILSMIRNLKSNVCVLAPRDELIPGEIVKSSFAAAHLQYSNEAPNETAAFCT